jgi:hypothetical protein
MLIVILHRARDAGHEDTGAVLVMFAAFASVAILLMSFVINVGNWFEHERHLQLQADAAAFAAAADFQSPCNKGVAETMYHDAGLYGGSSSVLGAQEGTFSTFTKDEEEEGKALFNRQVGETSQANIHEEINRKAYYNQALGSEPSETTTVEKAPCEASMVDVKMTETNLPWFFAAFNVPYINTHARVSITAETTASKVEPIIESEPVEARVFYVNDTSCLKGSKYEPCADGSSGNYENEMLATGLLENAGPNEENGTISWTDERNTKAAPLVPLTIGKVQHIGVRYAVAGKIGALIGPGNEGPSVCNHAYVECFDHDSGVVPPLLNIQGYSAEAEGAATPSWKPVTRRVTLSTETGNTCADAYFNKWPLSEKSATCTITLLAEVNYGKESEAIKGVTVVPKLVYTEGFANKKVEAEQTGLKYEGGLWKGELKIPSYYYGNFGSVEINLVVTCKPESKAPCEKNSKTETVTIKDVQRDFSAGPDGSNRVVGARIFEPGGLKPVPGERDANAFEFCEPSDENAKHEQECTHKLATTIELSGSLADAKNYFTKESPPSCADEKVSSTPACHPIPPFHVLYGDNDQENEDQFVTSCPPTVNPSGIEKPWQESLNNGCAGKYSVNSQGGSCAKEVELNNHECLGLVAVTENTGNFVPQKGKKCTRFVPEEPKPCENNEELLTLQFQTYLRKRIEGQLNGTRFECPNNWVNNNSGGVPRIRANDSRLVQFFVVPFTVTDFQRKGEVSPLIPITNFATFYITGLASGNAKVGQGTEVPWNPEHRRDQCSETLFHQESPWRVAGKSVGPLTPAERAELEDESKPLKQREQKEKEKGFDDDVEQPREILGHLLKYVNVLGEGSGTVTCKQESYETCEEKLTE